MKNSSKIKEAFTLKIVEFTINLLVERHFSRLQNLKSFLKLKLSEKNTNTTLLRILKKAIADKTSLRQVERDMKLIERLKNRVERSKIRAEEDIMKTLLNLNMNANSNFLKLSLENSLTPRSLTILQMIMKKIFNRQETRSFKGEKEDRPNKTR